MSLTSLFNFNYLKENIKKSKAIVLLCMFLLPTIGGIMLLVKCSQGGNFMPGFYEVSAPILFGMYIVPIILSITLFSFIYKRGSIDFTLSMPISKKQIFLTNTLGGIIIILLTQIVNLIITLIISLIYGNMIIDYKMLFDIFLVYFISYTFVFTACNAAASVSSNKITTIVVTLLILFLVPFITTFIKSEGFKYDISRNARIECLNKECTPIIYECNSVECEKNKKDNVYMGYVTKIDKTTYTMPYELIREVMFAESADTNMSISLLKMTFLSIVYIIIGAILFIKKRFEIVGISFKSERIHNFVRTLTTVPIICIIYMIIDNLDVSSSDFFTIILLLVLIFTYLIIYDLITRKRVTNFFKMAICLVIVSSVVCIIGSTFKDDNYYDIKVKDIKEITFVDDSNVNMGTTNNKEVINYIISLLLDEDPRGDVYGVYRVKSDINGKLYKFNVYVTEKDYNYINNMLLNDKEYLKTSDKYKNSKVFGIEYNDGYTKANNKLSNMIIEEYRKNNLTIKDNYFNDDENDLFDISLYIYNNYTVRKVDINIKKDSKLALELLKYYNSNTKKYFNKMKDEDIYSYDVDSNYFGVRDNVYYGEFFVNIGKFIVNNLDDEIDINKEYKYININSYDGRNIFVTNKVNELKDLAKNINNTEDTVNMGDVDETDYD